MTTLFANHPLPVALCMIQPEPLPGSYRHKDMPLGKIIDQAVREAAMAGENGFDGFILQNMNDMPVKQHSTPEAIAYMSVIGAELRRRFPNLVMGILMNWDGVSGLAVADAVGADFMRVEHLFTGVEVTSAGLLEGQCCEIAQLRKKLGTGVRVYADVYEAHGVPLGAKPFEDACWEAVNEGFADGLFVSGKSTEDSLRVYELAKKRLSPDIPVFLGGGANGDNVGTLLTKYDGVSVATWVKNGDMKNPIDPARAKIFMEQIGVARKARAQAVTK